MTTYTEYRAARIAAIAEGFVFRGPVLNNTGNSRQVRRARERDREREPALSNRLLAALNAIEWSISMTPPMGIMMYSVMSPVIGRRVKRYRAAYLHERQEPSEDYTGRYKALFAMSSGASVRKGQAGPPNP